MKKACFVHNKRLPLEIAGWEWCLYHAWDTKQQTSHPHSNTDFVFDTQSLDSVTRNYTPVIHQRIPTELPTKNTHTNICSLNKTITPHQVV